MSCGQRHGSLAGCDRPLLRSIRTCGCERRSTSFRKAESLCSPVCDRADIHRVLTAAGIIAYALEESEDFCACRMEDLLSALSASFSISRYDCYFSTRVSLDSGIPYAVFPRALVCCACPMPAAQTTKSLFVLYSSLTPGYLLPPTKHQRTTIYYYW